MRIERVGIHKVKRKLADGSSVWYHYAWRGGPRIMAKPHTRAYALEWARHSRGRADAPGTGTVAELIRSYVKSPAYTKRKASTRKGYDWAIRKIEEEFFDMPLAALGKGSRKTILEWRDRFADTPRAADMLLAVFRTIISFAVDREDIEHNPLEGVTKLSDPTRRDIIWTDEQIATFKAKAPARLVLALELARWTGQRQGDLLRLTWSAYDGTHLTLRQAKTGSSVRVLVAAELKALLDSQKRTAVTIVTNRSGMPYKQGFRSSFAKAQAAAKIEGVTFHDLRGTFITLAYREGATFKEIADVSGHSEKDAERIIRKHYLAGDAAVLKLEARTKRDAIGKTGGE
jgi:integrase